MATAKSEHEYLVDRNEIAYLFGVGPTAVSNYVVRLNKKYKKFPQAVITRGFGRFRLWDIADVVSWHIDTFPDRDLDIDNLDRDSVIKIVKKFREVNYY
jgi:hypothetical protein